MTDAFYAVRTATPASEFLRRCWSCGAGFGGLAVGLTGERGIWDSGRGLVWYCSQECYEAQPMNRTVHGSGMSVVLSQPHQRQTREAVPGFKTVETADLRLHSGQAFRAARCCARRIDPALRVRVLAIHPLSAKEVKP